ncbi:MAG: hypothetical protein ACM34A_12280 [Bacillota bacterium]
MQSIVCVIARPYPVLCSGARSEDDRRDTLDSFNLDGALDQQVELLKIDFIGLFLNSPAFVLHIRSSPGACSRIFVGRRIYRTDARPDIEMTYSLHLWPHLGFEDEHYRKQPKDAGSKEIEKECVIS